MPPINSKNYAMTPSVADLGLADSLNQQVEDETADAKKKKAALKGNSLNSPAVMTLGMDTMN